MLVAQRAQRPGVLQPSGAFRRGLETFESAGGPAHSTTLLRRRERLETTRPNRPARHASRSDAGGGRVRVGLPAVRLPATPHLPLLDQILWQVREKA